MTIYKKIYNMYYIIQNEMYEEEKEKKRKKRERMKEGLRKRTEKKSRHRISTDKVYRRAASPNSAACGATSQGAREEEKSAARIILTLGLPAAARE